MDIHSIGEAIRRQWMRAILLFVDSREALAGLANVLQIEECFDFLINIKDNGYQMDLSMLFLDHDSSG